MKKKLSIFFSVTIIISTFAQSEFTLGMMEHVYQSTYVNMTAKPSHKVSVGLPGLSSVYGAIAFSGLKFEDLYNVLPNNKTEWSVTKIKNVLSTNSMLYNGVSVDLFHLRIKSRNTFLSFHVRNVFTSYIGLPSALGLVITADNVQEGSNKPKNWDFSGLSADVTHYNEYAFGISSSLKKFSYGFRVKFLQGLSNISTENNNSGISFNDQFQVNATGNIRANISSPLDSNNKVKNDFKFSDYFSNFNNLGFATDLSLAYKLNQKLTFSLSVNDIGFIGWRTNGRYEELNESITFSGINNLQSLIQGKPIDSLNYNFNNINTKKGLVDSYSKFLIPNLYFIAKYDITSRWSISGTIFAQKYHTVRLGLSAGSQLKIGNLLSLAANIKYQYSALNLGFGIVLKPGPFQIYLATDNIPFGIQPITNNSGNLMALHPSNTNQFNIRFGINLVFGKEIVPQSQPLSY